MASKLAALSATEKEVELRYLSTAELRVEGGKQPKIRGHAALFDTWSEKLFGFFREKIRPGAFAKTIQEADVRALVNHDPGFVLGRNKAGTLRLREDSRGLAVEILPPDTQWAEDLIVSMKRGDVNQMSFGFETVRDSWNSRGDERELIEVRLLDVSVVTFPAYPQTSANVRNLMQSRTERKPARNLECYLRKQRQQELEIENDPTMRDVMLDLAAERQRDERRRMARGY